MLTTGSGFQNMLKEGARHYSGLEEAILRNIDACVQISKITRTSLGPMGMNKIVVTHLEKVYVTSDAATLVEEMEVHHPAAKMLTMAAKMQETEAGDGTNFVLVFGGELLQQAEGLLKMGLHPAEILIGYEKAYKKCLSVLPTLVTYSVSDLRDKAQVVPCLESVIATKLYGFESFLAPLVFEACRYAYPERDLKHFDVEHVRVAKILGSSLTESSLVHGLVIVRGSETSFTHVKGAKIALFNCPIEAGQGETKGTVLLKNAQELLGYTKSEEANMEHFIASVKDAGVNVVVAGGNVSEVALHFFEKYQIMVIKILSKFELRRIAHATGASMLVRYVRPTSSARTPLVLKKSATATRSRSRRSPVRRSPFCARTRTSAASPPSSSAPPQTTFWTTPNAASTTVSTPSSAPSETPASCRVLGPAKSYPRSHL